VREEREEKFVNFLLSNQGFCEPRKTILSNSFAEIVNLFSYHEAKALSCQAKVEQLKNVKRSKHHFVDLSATEKINQLLLDP
jgi:hypothetical protein